MEKKILITTDNVCDLPEDILREYDIPAIHFYITTDHGCFRDLDEITSGNIIEYFANGGKHIATQSPSVEDYEEFFQYVLESKECDEIIHITITLTHKFFVRIAQFIVSSENVYNNSMVFNFRYENYMLNIKTYFFILFCSYNYKHNL